MQSNSTGAEITTANRLVSFDSDGFSYGTQSNLYVNSTNSVAWNWKANGGTTTSVSESGSNPANVRQTNATAGFSIITYTGTGSNGTIAHGLGVKPDWVIVKRRDGSGWSWYVQHVNVFSGRLGSIYLNGTATGDDDATHWNDTAPTSSVVTVGTSNGINQNDGTYVMYAFAPVEGYSKFGSYTGNGNADGTFVFTGFRPAWVMVKTTSLGSQYWNIFDNVRDPFNDQSTQSLYSNVTDSEGTGNVDIDFLSNGMKMRDSGNNHNSSGHTYMYMAFAEAPFKYANAR